MVIEYRNLKTVVFHVSWRYTEADIKRYPTGDGSPGTFGGPRRTVNDVDHFRVVVGLGVHLDYDDFIVERLVKDALGGDKWESCNDRKLIVSRILMTMMRMVLSDRCKDTWRTIETMDLGEITMETLS